MSTRTLLNLILLAIVSALALIAYLKPGLEPETKAQPLAAGIDPDAVGSIRIERLARDPLEFARRDAHWYLRLDDGELPASEFQVHALLRLLQATARHSYPATSLDLAALGLDPPQATLRIDAMEFRFGVTEALEDRRYLQREDTVYLIDDQYQHLLNAERANFISRKLLAGRDTITRLELPGMTLVYSEDGHWRLDPENSTAGADALQQLVDSWLNASALYVRRYAGEDSGKLVTLHTRGDDEPLTFRIISRSPDLILARPDRGIQYHLTNTMEDNLFTLPEPAPDAAPDTAGSSPD